MPEISATDPDPFNLSRFIDAQSGIFAQALSELRSGRKRSHWMWFIFPQMLGLGYSTTSRYYALRSLDEARAYLDHPVLGQRLRECAGVLLELEGLSATDIFDFPDDLKFRSSMTLFAAASGPDSVFERLLEKYFEGQRDERTLVLLKGAR